VRRPIASIVVLVVVVVVGLVPAHANPVDAFGFGGRAPAMGGAQTAATIDGGANYYNPAALARGEAIRVDLGYQLAQPYLTLNGGDQGVDTSRGLYAALSAPGRIFGLKVAIGAGIFLPDERITRTRTLPAQRPRWSLYDNRPQRIFLGSNLAVQLGDDLWLGGGIAYMSRTRGTLDLEGRIGFPDSEDSQLDLAIDVDLITVRYPQGGVLWRAQPWLLVGLSFRGGFVLELNQKFSIRGDVGPEGGNPVVDNGYFALHSVAMDLFQPEQWSVGFSAQLTRRLLVAGDVTWQRWSAFENPAASIAIDYDLKDFNDLVVIPDAPPLPDAFFHDTIVPRVGVEWVAAETRHSVWHVRAGYAFEPSPAPAQIVETNFVDNDKHTLSMGLGATIFDVSKILERPFAFDLYVAATFLPDRSHHKLSPVDPIGDYVSSGFVFQTGFGTRWSF
jgi:hypothetical protein